MGGKRKWSKRNAGATSSTYDGKRWPDCAVDELLSYLNSEIAFLDPATNTWKDRDFEDLEQGAAQYLDSLRNNADSSLEQIRSYSTSKIRSKLQRLFIARRRNEPENNDWSIIYRQGFACLDWRHDKQREERMARRSKEIKDAWELKYMCSPRKTRAGSQVTGFPQAGSRKAIRASSRASKSSSMGIDSNVAGGSFHRRVLEIDDGLHAPTSESLATDNDEGVPIKTENVDQTPSIRVDSEHSGICRPRLSLENSQEISESENEAFGTPLRSCSPAGCGNHVYDGNLTPNRESQSISEFRKRLHAKDEELQAVRRDMELEIDFWKTEARTAQQERLRWRKAYQAQIAQLNILRSPNGSQLSSDALVEQKAAIVKLLDERELGERLRTLKRHTDTEPSKETILKVCELMRERDITANLQEALKDAKFLSSAELRTLPYEHPLRSLVEQAFGVRWNSSEAAKTMEHWHERPWLQQYGLLALCGAALERWVFQQTEADILFDRYQDVGTRSSTSRYREAIKLVGHDDQALARTVDLLVHQSLAKDACFEHFQKAKAKDLARKLQGALRPLCDLDSYAGDHSDADSGVDGDAISHLSDVFFRAINAHCRLVLTGWRYECIWPEPGVAFDETSMSLCTGQTARAADARDVRLTLLPGINQITASKIGIDFGGFAERRHQDHEEAVCVLRAVVLCGSADLHQVVSNVP